MSELGLLIALMVFTILLMGGIMYVFHKYADRRDEIEEDWEVRHHED